MPRAFICHGCGNVVPEERIKRGWCDQCRPARERELNARRNRRPKAKAIYRTARWQRTRELVLARDGHQCQRCGTRRHLSVHHAAGYADPFDPAGLVTLCTRCHGTKGAKRTAR